MWVFREWKFEFSISLAWNVCGDWTNLQYRYTVHIYFRKMNEKEQLQHSKPNEIPHKDQLPVSTHMFRFFSVTIRRERRRRTNEKSNWQNTNTHNVRKRNTCVRLAFLFFNHVDINISSVSVAFQWKFKP